MYTFTKQLLKSKKATITFKTWEIDLFIEFSESLLSKKNPVYAELQKQVNDAAKSKTLSLDENLSDFETKVIRLGYLSDIESKEADQNKILENRIFSRTNFIGLHTR